MRIQIPIPILLKQNAFSNPIGRIVEKDGKMCVEFHEDVKITREMFFEIFGSTNARVTDTETLEDGTIIIRSGYILELSFNWKPVDSSAQSFCVKDK